LQDRMPAIVYGPKKEATPVTISLLEFKRILREGGESSVIDITGIGASMQVLVQEVDRDPVTNQPRHADFYAIEKGAKVEVAVPISFIGESPAVKEGANLVKVLHEIEVESDPSKLPHEIEVDISSLVAIGDQIHIKDIKFPTGVVVKLEEDEVVVLVQAIAEEEESTEAPNMDAIEVEQKGKADGASEEAAAE